MLSQTTQAVPCDAVHLAYVVPVTHAAVVMHASLRDNSPFGEVRVVLNSFLYEVLF